MRALISCMSPQKRGGCNSWEPWQRNYSNLTDSDADLHSASERNGTAAVHTARRQLSLSEPSDLVQIKQKCSAKSC